MKDIRLECDPKWYSNVDFENPFIVDKIYPDELEIYTSLDRTYDRIWNGWNRSFGGPLENACIIRDGNEASKAKLNKMKKGILYSKLIDSEPYFYISEKRGIKYKSKQSFINHNKTEYRRCVLYYRKRYQELVNDVISLGNRVDKNLFHYKYILNHVVEEYDHKDLFDIELFEDFLDKLKARCRNNAYFFFNNMNYDDINKLENAKKLYDLVISDYDGYHVTSFDDYLKLRLGRITMNMYLPAPFKDYVLDNSENILISIDGNGQVIKIVYSPVYKIGDDDYVVKYNKYMLLQLYPGCFVSRCDELYTTEQVTFMDSSPDAYIFEELCGLGFHPKRGFTRNNLVSREEVNFRLKKVISEFEIENKGVLDYVKNICQKMASKGTERFTIQITHTTEREISALISCLYMLRRSLYFYSVINNQVFKYLDEERSIDSILTFEVKGKWII